MTGVTTTHPQYQAMHKEWERTRALVHGSRAVKDLGVNVLPPPDLEEGGTYDKHRYKYYKQRAIFTNITGRTKTGLCGAAFRDRPEIELNGALEFLANDADGMGNSLEQMIKDVFADIWSSGRECLMVDMPKAQPGLTRAQEVKLNIRPCIRRYTAVDFINWRDDKTLAVLRESQNTSEDEFGHDSKYRYRVLRLRNGVYTQQEYDDAGEPIDAEIGILAGKEPVKFLPLFVIGSQNNDWTVDDVPLSDIADINIGHFVNSADAEECAHVCGQATPHIDIGTMTYDVWAQANPDGVKLGSRSGVQTSGGKLEMVQAEERNIHIAMMQVKEKQMVAVGARYIEKRDSSTTATEARIDASGENSVIGDIATNVEEGFRRALEWCAMFAKTDIDAESALVLSRKFFDDRLDPQAAIAAMQFYDRGLADKDDMLEVGKRASIIRADKTVDDIKEVSPLAGPKPPARLDRGE